MSTKKFEALRRLWAESCIDSDVGLWWIADDVRQQLESNASEEEVRANTLEAIQPLLASGLVRAVNLLSGGVFEPWDMPVKEVLARINREWIALGRPPDIGDIVWFIGKRSDG